MRNVLTILLLATAAPAQIYVAPHGDDSNPGTESRPIRTLNHARDLVRARNRALAADLTVRLAPGNYRLTQPLELDARDSGSNGHNVIYTSAAEGQYPVVSGAVAVTGWKLIDKARNLWSAPAPEALGNTRQIYVDGVRAHRARGRLPVEVMQTEAGYTASSAAMAKWRNPGDIEFVYTGGNSIWNERSQGLGPWTEPRCPVAAIQGANIVMAQPCWANSTKRIMLPSGERTANLVGGASVGKQPAYVENAYELLGTAGEWYFDRPARVLYYVPRPGEDLAKADVEAPEIESLIAAAGTAGAPIHNVVFSGLQFSYATWLRPSTPEGFSEIQANYTLTGPHAWATQGLCKLVPNGECPYGAWTKTPGNVRLQYSHDVQFRNDVFTHLGAAGLDLGDGAQNDSVEGCAFTDISGNGVELGAVDKPLATGADITRDNRIRNNHIWNIGAEYRGGIGIVVGYAQRSAVEHNQIDHTPYAAISMGWGGWPDKIRQAGQANYSENNRVANNRIFDFMLVLADGGGIYTQGLTGPDLARGEKVTGNAVYEQFGSGHGIYTDNGSCNITVAGNIMFHLNFDNWGSRHRNYYNGADGSANDPLEILDNYWQQGGADASAQNVTLRGNRIINSLDQAPRAVLGAAGLEPAFQGLLGRHFGPAAPPEPPSRVAAVAGNGYALVTWSPPVFEAESAVESYSVTAWTRATAAARTAVAPVAVAPSCRDPERGVAEYRGAECRGSERGVAEYRSAECRGSKRGVAEYAGRRVWVCRAWGRRVRGAECRGGERGVAGLRYAECPECGDAECLGAGRGVGCGDRRDFGRRISERGLRQTGRAEERHGVYLHGDGAEPQWAQRGVDAVARGDSRREAIAVACAAGECAGCGGGQRPGEHPLSGSGGGGQEGCGRADCGLHHHGESRRTEAHLHGSKRPGAGRYGAHHFHGDGGVQAGRDVHVFGGGGESRGRGDAGGYRSGEDSGAMIERMRSPAPDLQWSRAAWSMAHSVGRAVAPVETGSRPSSTALTKSSMQGKCRLAGAGICSTPPGYTSAGPLSGVRSSSPSVPRMRNSSRGTRECQRTSTTLRTPPWWSIITVALSSTWMGWTSVERWPHTRRGSPKK